MGKFQSLLWASTLFFSSFLQAQIIQVNYTGSVTDLGSELTGDAVNLGDVVLGSFTYNSDLGQNDGLTAFSISIGSSFTATANSGGTLYVQNDQQNGSATLPADAFTVSSTDISSTSLNGHTVDMLQFGLRRQNLDGDLWADTLLPDLTDWLAITLVDLNAADWHWMDFGVDTILFSDDQIRWDIGSFTVSEVSLVPEPASITLLLLGLAGLGASRYRNTT